MWTKINTRQIRYLIWQSSNLLFSLLRINPSKEIKNNYYVALTLRILRTRSKRTRSPHANTALMTNKQSRAIIHIFAINRERNTTGSSSVCRTSTRARLVAPNPRSLCKVHEDVGREQITVAVLRATLLSSYAFLVIKSEPPTPRTSKLFIYLPNHTASVSNTLRLFIWPFRQSHNPLQVSIGQCALIDWHKMVLGVLVMQIRAYTHL